MCTTAKRWERVFYFITFFTQGSSYLVPAAYAVMHRTHHKYGDTEKDPRFIMMGELFQNNHHYKKFDPNFARRWYEFDSTYIIMTALQYYEIIKLKPLTAWGMSFSNYSPQTTQHHNPNQHNQCPTKYDLLKQRNLISTQHSIKE
jgi:hypothetical protein